MSIAAIEAVLHDRLALLTGIDIAWPDQPYVPTVGRPYLAPTLVARQRRSMGAGPSAAHQWIGTYQVSVYWPAGEGPGAYNAQIDALIAHFPRALTLPTSAGRPVIIEEATPQPKYDAGDWVNAPVVMQWFLNIGD
jgi:hypothetical protein